MKIPQWTIGNSRIPSIGFGTADLRGDVVALIETALEAGYRLIDTAAAYDSEEAVGIAVKRFLQSGRVEREELFIETKVMPGVSNYDQAIASVMNALDRMQLHYIDMVMLHWPVNRGHEMTYRRENREVWHAFEHLIEKGKVRMLGVCNFLERHLLDLINNSCTKPVINQLEIHPAYQQKGLVTFCREQGMAVEAWSPMGRGILLKEEYSQMADYYHKNIGQLALRWSHQHGFIPLTRSSNPEHIRKNLEVFDFEISPEHMSIIDDLNTNDQFMPIWSYKRQQMY